MVIKTYVVLSKKGGVWTDQLILIVISGCGQSSCYYLGILAFKVLSDLREREFLVRQKPPREDRIKTLVFTSVVFYSPLIFDSPVFGSYYVLLRLLYKLLYVLYFHPYSLV